MANKKSNVQSASAEDVKSNEEVELTEAEKTALEVEEAAAQGKEASDQKYKLADPNTSYQEPEFTLAADQEKPLPADPSNELIARIQSGFIKKA